MERLVYVVLFVGVFLTPFTSFRLGAVGPGEVLIFASALLHLLAVRGKLFLDQRLRSFVLFWFWFLSFSLLGLLYNTFALEPASGRPFTPAFDFFSYCFVLMTIVLFGSIMDRKVVRPQVFFKRLFVSWALAYTLLYITSFFTAAIFGFPLRYYQYFSPLVENVHQASSITCVMPFIMLYYVFQPGTLPTRFFFLVAALLFGKMAMDSGTTKALLGVVFGTGMAGYAFVAFRSQRYNRYIVNAALLCVTVAIMAPVAMLYREQIDHMASRFFMENDGSDAREALYSVGFKHGLKSLLVGYGPGSHAPYDGGFSDAHNTVLTILLQAGIFGVLQFVIFVIRILRMLSFDFALLGAVSAIGMYTLGGDILRRLPIWIILVGIVYLSRSHDVSRAQQDSI